MNPLNKGGDDQDTELPGLGGERMKHRGSIHRDEDRNARKGKLQNLHETRDEALERGAQRNLAADQDTFNDFLAYNIENR